MHFKPENLAELDVLLLYDLSSSQAGIKIHHTAESQMIAAAQSLFAKGIISQADGGYLTELGWKAAEHAQALFTMLNAHDGAA